MNILICAERVNQLINFIYSSLVQHNQQKTFQETKKN